MSDAGEKRHEATPAKRRRARREGNVARSSELTSIAAFGAATLTAAVAVPLAAAAAIAAVRESAKHTALATSMPAETSTAITALASSLALLLCAALLPLGAAASAGALAAFAQSGGLHLAPPHLEVKRLDPIAGVKRMIGIEAVVALARAALAFTAALFAVVPIVRDVVGGAAALGSPAAAAALAAPAALRACGTALAVGALFAVFDYALARRRWLHGLRMSSEELKRDAKENDGDPHTRARRKSAHRAVVRGTVGRTREASFVVVNPTHVAVALRYAPPAVSVPEILVRALDEAALRVRSIAREHRIPLVEDVALARLLYAQGETGRAIPPQTYVAVAHVVAALAREGLLA
ncbi:MAG TPA: EscU/YscU/HrcU family type III secretion system export apparatus switch protein [Candidatus Elarobacter sp.]|nr:EscU/YscU/HrcU family type III secretion system export apparatus switch protein [Candidatus Elarobacter sp.]